MQYNRAGAAATAAAVTAVIAMITANKYTAYFVVWWKLKWWKHFNMNDFVMEWVPMKSDVHLIDTFPCGIAIAFPSKFDLMHMSPVSLHRTLYIQHGIL